MMTVYVLQHVHSLEHGEEDFKFIGVYSSRDNAQEAVRRLSQSPGFSESPDGFCIDEYQLDKDQWIEGYVTVTSG
jgi:hypothetical protein